MSPRSKERINLLSPKARRDLSVVYTYTAETWGTEQADKYIEFLVLAIAELAANPRLGYCVNNRKNLRAYTAKWRKSKHGHRIIYREIKDGIYVLRILHTAMNLPEQI